MVQQAAPGEDLFWTLPSGRVEDGELVTEALAREVLEETGLEVVDPGGLAFVLHLDNRRTEPLHHGRGPTGGYVATVWTFDVGEWRGTLRPQDPDGFVADARFVPVREAIEQLALLEWQAATVSYLCGQLDAGSVVSERWHADGTVEKVATIPALRTA